MTPFVSLPWRRASEVVYTDASASAFLCPAEEATWVEVNPLGNPKLWTKFALKDVTREKALKLCREHGFLSYQRRPHTYPPEDFSGESLTFWKRELHLLWLVKHLMGLLEEAPPPTKAVEYRNTVDALVRLIPPAKDLWQDSNFTPLSALAIQSLPEADQYYEKLVYGSVVEGQEESDPSMDEITLGPPEILETLEFSMLESVEDVDDTEQGEGHWVRKIGATREASNQARVDWDLPTIRHAVIEIINRKVGGHTVQVVLSDKGTLTVSLVPKDLLSGLWIQLAQHVAGSMGFWQCEHCGTLFARVKGTHKDKRFCDPCGKGKLSRRARGAATQAPGPRTSVTTASLPATDGAGKKRTPTTRTRKKPHPER